MLLCLTAASGSVPNLEVAMRAAGCQPAPHTYEAPAGPALFSAAAAAGSLEACQWLHQQGYPMGYAGTLDFGGNVLNAAARGGHMHVCEWLLTLDAIWVWGAEEAAAEGGHMVLMEWLIRRRRQLRYIQLPSDGFRRKHLAAAVARGCDLPTLQRLWPPWGETPQENSYKAEVLVSAAGSPTPDWAAKVEWLESQGCLRTEEAVVEAAARPDALERLTWLRGRERGYHLGVTAVEAAARSGRTAALQYLLGEGVRPQPWDNQPAMRAAEGGHLPALQALHAAGWPVDGPRAAEAAARGGHLHVVAWLVETLGAALLGAELFAAAAEPGNVELMAWLRQRGCGWEAAALTAAARGGCEEALEWLAAQGCPVPENGDPYNVACQQGDLSTPPALLRLGVPWGDPCDLVPRVLWGRAPLPTLRWLLEAGCPLDAAAVKLKLRGLQTRHVEYSLEAAEVLTRHRPEHDWGVKR